MPAMSLDASLRIKAKAEKLLLSFAEVISVRRTNAWRVARQVLWPDDWMNSLAQKTQQYLVITAEQLKTFITENPVVVPVLWVEHTVLADVSGSIWESRIS